MNKSTSKKMVLKIVTSKWQNESRDKRELSVAKELGADVLVMAKGNKSGVVEQVEGYNVYRMSTRPLGKYIPNVINRSIAILTWAFQVKKLSPQVISGHDIGALFIGYLSTLFLSKENKPKLVYDSHEFEMGRNGRRNCVIKQLVKGMEGYLIRRCEFSIMVNDGIADEVQKIHNLKERPIAVRNIPEQWNVNYDECLKVRREILGNFESKDYFLLMYHGSLIENRGIETLIQFVGIDKNVALFILGNGEEEYVYKLKVLASKAATNRIKFHEAVPQNKLWKYVGAADVGMIVAPAISKNHLHSLPNKFFENIQAETPIICPDYPAMKKLIEYYGIGLTCRVEDMKSIFECVEQMRTDKEFYQKCVENIKKTKSILSWEKEREILKSAYKTIL